MRKTLIVIIGAIIIMLTTICSIGLLEKWNNQNTIQLLIVGDSIGEGAGASDPVFKWYKYLMPYFEDQYGKKLEITNVSMGGNTSYAGYVRIMQLNKTEKYDLVIVCFGENDDEEGFASYYEQLLQTVVNRWPSSTVITILESSQREYTSKIEDIKTLSLKYQAYIVDTIAAFRDSGMTYEELCDDGTHPNDKGQKLYFNEVRKVFDKIYSVDNKQHTEHVPEATWKKDKASEDSGFYYYSKDAFEEVSSFECKVVVGKNVSRIGIDYNRIPGHQEIAVQSDEQTIWKYSYDWNYDFKQQHIEVIDSKSQYLNELIIRFSSKEQLEGFNGVIIEQ